MKIVHIFFLVSKMLSWSFRKNKNFYDTELGICITREKFLEMRMDIFQDLNSNEEMRKQYLVLLEEGKVK